MFVLLSSQRLAATPYGRLVLRWIAAVWLPTLASQLGAWRDKHRPVAYSKQIALRYIRSKKRATVSMITLISIIGVALGVAALLAVLSITTGFERAFRDKVLGVNAHVLILKYGRDFRDYREILESVVGRDEVAGAAPFLINEMMLSKKDRLAGVLVKGVDPKGVREVLDLPQQLVEGSLDSLRLADAQPAEGNQVEDDHTWEWLEEFSQKDDKPAAPSTRKPGWERASTSSKNGNTTKEKVASPADVENLLNASGSDDWALPDDADWEASLAGSAASADKATLPGIVIGRTLAEDLDIAVGEVVKLISPLTGLDLSYVDSSVPATRSREFRVIAIFEAGFQEYDSRLVYTDLYEAQRFYDQGDSVTGIELRVHDLATSRSLARNIEQDLSGAFHTLDWSELNRNLFTALEVQKIALTLVIATIIFVAAFNVIATLIMIVLEKKREIAILKAMGATDRTILSIFMIQGVVVGVVGTALGVVVGAGLIAYLRHIRFPLDPKVYLIDHLPVVFSLPVVGITVAIALGICALATIAPSWWAARMLPVDGLRYE